MLALSQIPLSLLPIWSCQQAKTPSYCFQEISRQNEEPPILLPSSCSCLTSFMVGFRLAFRSPYFHSNRNRRDYALIDLLSSIEY